jgi:hypothetical protein
MDVLWDVVIVRRNKNPQLDEFAKEKAGEAAAYQERKRMLAPEEMVYKAEEGYKGAHFDHFSNFFRAVREAKPVIEDAVFGFRAAAPALACNDSYFRNEIVHWDPVAMKRIN